jgi:subtilisin family serine protease
MQQIHTPEAHAITGGSPSVLVGDIDTGLDYTHPDLAPNVDSANSANCVSGAPVPGAVAANDDNGHGTHTAGTIAAASNGIGIVGVAPNVKIAGIKAGTAAGFFFPEAVICSFIWAGTHGFDVTNNSYFADPWLFNCRNDPVQRAIWTGERRAIEFAQRQGVVVVAAEGNQSDDLAHPTQDVTSPDDTTPVTRDITNACAVVPVEVPGVIGVTADGNKEIKSWDVDGLPARGGRRRSRREPVRAHEPGARGGVTRADRRSDRLPGPGDPGALRAVHGDRQRCAANVPGRYRQQRLVRQRSGERARRGDALALIRAAIDLNRGAGASRPLAPSGAGPTIPPWSPDEKPRSCC